MDIWTNGLIRRIRAMISLPLPQCIPFTLPERKKNTRVGDDRLSYLRSLLEGELVMLQRREGDERK